MSISGVVQPLNYNPTQVASVTGLATWTLPLLAAGEMWEFTVNCPVAPSTARLTINSGGNVLGYVKGSNSWGPIQIQGGEQLVVNATGLVPETTYYLNVIGVVVNGGSGLEEKYPAAYADTVTAGFENIYLGLSSVTAAKVLVVNNVPFTSSTKYIWVTASWDANQIPPTSPIVGASFTLPGGQQITSYGYQVYISPGALQLNYYRIFVPAGVSLNPASIQLQWGTSCDCTIYYGLEMGVFDSFVYNSPSIPLNVVSPPATPLLVNTYASPYPSGAVSSGGGSTGVLSNTSGSASIAAVVGKTCWLTGFEVTYSGATAGLAVEVTVSGLAQGSLYYIVDVPAGVTSSGNAFLAVSFPYPLPASATNTAITLSLPASGAGGYGAGNIHGYTI